MRSWQAAMTPGEPHQWLAHAVGNWKLTTKVWAGGPGAEPATSEGTCRITSILGGRFIQEEFDSTLMGQPYHGTTILGYDNFKGCFVGMFINSMDTAMATFRGFLKPDRNELVLWGTMDEPMLNLRDVPVKYVMRVVDDNSAVFEVHNMMLDEGHTKVVELDYTRQ
jgi:hypothetical protein